jgi:hypothetical protein
MNMKLSRRGELTFKFENNLIAFVTLVLYCSNYTIFCIITPKYKSAHYTKFRAD